ncbi:hypothetical protein ACH427_28110 [Streptomyces sp. NPDC020379]|uniref:hypothetical protein n=1 Tax=Streptomyces sp. NPDC020379 TaxID=3365071 RepID=UPI0037A0DC2C
MKTELDQRQGHQARGIHHALLGIFRALKQQRVIFRNPMAGLTLTAPMHLPLPVPSDRLRHALRRLNGPLPRLAVALVAIHGLKLTDVARLRLDDPDMSRRTLAVRRGQHTHIVYLDDITMELMAAWLTERHRRWSVAPNPHLLITAHGAYHPDQRPISYCALRAAFDQTGITPRQGWTDRVLYEAQQTADPLHLVRLFSTHPNIAVKYVNAAHPDRAPPAIR